MKWTMRMKVAEAEKQLAELVNQVYLEGVCIDLEHDDKVVARLTPVEPASPLTIANLNSFLRNLPALGDDAKAFAEDIRAIRAENPAQANQWD